MKISHGKEHLGKARADPGIGFWVASPRGVTQPSLILQQQCMAAHAVLSTGAPSSASLLTQSTNLTDSTPEAKTHVSRKHLIQLVLCGPRPQAYRNQTECSRGSELISQKLATGQSPGDRPFLGMCRGRAARAC